MEHESACPYCGEPATLWLEDAEGEQRYVEDCAVRCRPSQVTVWRDEDGELQAAIARLDE